MNEAEVKYMLTEEYEKLLIEENIKNYDFEKLLNYSPFKFELIYNVDEETGKLQEGAEDTFIFYGRCKVFKRNEPLVSKERINFPGGELFKAEDAFIVLGLNKEIAPSYKMLDKETLEGISIKDFQKIKKNRLLPKWMDYNYIYVLGMSNVKGKKEPKDEIFPYLYKVDLFEYKRVNLIDSDKMAVQFSKDKEAMVFVFKHILEAGRFFRMSRKAKENVHEIYYIGAHEIRINVDLCENFGESLVKLRELCGTIINQMYDGLTIVNDENILRKFSEELHKYMIGFNCKQEMEHKYLAIFLEQFQSIYYEKIRSSLGEATTFDDEEKEARILELINNCKFHEEFLKKWKIFDGRINMTTKVNPYLHPLHRLNNSNWYPKC